MRQAQPLRKASAIVYCVLISALWLTGDAQSCSVRVKADDQCTDELILSLSLRADDRLKDFSMAPVAKPVQVSQLAPSAAALVGLSYLTIQRLMHAPPSEESLEPQAIWAFGRVAQLEARLRDIDALLRAFLESFFQSQGPASTSTNRELTLLFNLDSPGLFLPAQIESMSSFALDERLHLYLSRATITLRTVIGPSSVIGELELDPEDFNISREKIGLELSLGPASLSGMTTFEQGIGLISQVYSIKAQVGNVELIGQATFTSTSQEFTIGASIAGLALSGSSLITSSGLTQQSIFIEIPIRIGPSKK
jgi:hypothetical protein